jgi:hypothetical protein
MGWEAIFIWRSRDIDLRRDIDNDRFFLTDALPSMIDSIGYLNEQRIVDSDEEFIDLSFGRRVSPGIVKDQFDHPPDGTDMIGLDFMIMPGLHHLGIGGGEIDLTELQKQVIIRPENLHDSSPVIRDHSQRFRPHSLNHFIPLYLRLLRIPHFFIKILSPKVPLPAVFTPTPALPPSKGRGFVGDIFIL